MGCPETKDLTTPCTEKHNAGVLNKKIQEKSKIARNIHSQYSYIKLYKKEACVANIKCKNAFCNFSCGIRCHGEVYQPHLDDMKLLSDTETFLTAMKKGCDFFKHPAILWKNGNLNQRRRLVQMIFQDRPQFNRENGLLTARSSWIFNKKSAQMDGKSDLAAPTSPLDTQ